MLLQDLRVVNACLLPIGALSQDCQIQLQFPLIITDLKCYFFNISLFLTDRPCFAFSVLKLNFKRPVPLIMWGRGYACVLTCERPMWNVQPSQETWPVLLTALCDGFTNLGPHTLPISQEICLQLPWGKKEREWVIQWNDIQAIIHEAWYIVTRRGIPPNLEKFLVDLISLLVVSVCITPVSGVKYWTYIPNLPLLRPIT